MSSSSLPPPGTGPAVPDSPAVHSAAGRRSFASHGWRQRTPVPPAVGRPRVAVDLPGHGHSDAGAVAGSAGRLAVGDLAADVAVAVRALAPQAAGVVGMSLGGLTTLALSASAPDLVRRVVLVDVLPTLDPRGAAAIAAFVHGPASFDSFDELLARTMAHNPTR